MTASRSFGIGERTFDKYVWNSIKLMSESSTSLMKLLIKYSDTLVFYLHRLNLSIGLKEGQKDKIITYLSMVLFSQHTTKNLLIKSGIRVKLIIEQG